MLFFPDHLCRLNVRTKSPEIGKENNLLTLFVGPHPARRKKVGNTTRVVKFKHRCPVGKSIIKAPTVLVCCEPENTALSVFGGLFVLSWIIFYHFPGIVGLLIGSFDGLLRCWRVVSVTRRDLTGLVGKLSVAVVGSGSHFREI